MTDYVDFLAGCFGGCAGVLVGHPFDTVKVRLQTQNPRYKLYHGTFDCFRKIIRQESANGLYKGVASPLYSLAFISAIIFGVQGNVQRRLTSPDSLCSHAISGATAGFVQSFLCSPMELVKTRIQVQGLGESLVEYKHCPHQYKGTLDCFLKILRNEGFTGIFRGLGLTICREVPAFSSYFVTYKYSCDLFSPADPKLETSILGMLMAGGIAGVVSWIIVYPVDVIKSRIQADGVNARSMYTGSMDCLKKSYRSEGFRGLFRGVNTTLIRAFPVNAATFVTVELFLDWAKVGNDEMESTEVVM